MVRCIARQDGYIDGHYVAEGEEFVTAVCPRWAGEKSPARPVEQSPNVPDKSDRPKPMKKTAKK